MALHKMVLRMRMSEKEAADFFNAITLLATATGKYEGSCDTVSIGMARRRWREFSEEYPMHVGSCV